MTISASGPRRLLLVAVLGPVAATAAACSSPASSSPLPAPRTSYASPAHVARCATSALRIKVGARTGATGIANRNIDFTNIGSAKCFLQGYPAAAMVSAGSSSGNLIGAYARPNYATPSKPIVLASGQTAHTVVSIYELGSHIPTNCDPVTPHWLKVFPPGQTTPAYVPFSARICKAGAARTLQITPIVAGA